MTTVAIRRISIEERCEQFINKMTAASIADYVETGNRIIKRYRERFGAQTYQVFPLDDGLLSLIAIAESIDGQVALFGYETIINGNTVTLGNFLCAVVEQRSTELNRAFLKMIVASNKL